MLKINTVTGTCTPQELGTTLVHEHLLIAWSGWEADSITVKGFKRNETLKFCVDRLQELKAHGVNTFMDPCPSDLGRDVDFMAEVSAKSSMRVICATGLYKEDLGGAYFKFYRELGSAGVTELAEVYEKEITEGIGDTGIKPGFIKCATGVLKDEAGRPHITPYEEMCLHAAARAQRATDVPITTHTDNAMLGLEQLAIFTGEGVDPRRVIIGHSGDTANLQYHVSIMDQGAYLGCDRFGLEIILPDKLRLASVIGLCGVGYANKIVLSHDSVGCFKGRAMALPSAQQHLIANWQPTHLFKNLLPKMREAGVSEDKIRMMLVDNPRRWFAGE
ncbi:MAG TPA: phosphotriesterase-related protein [Candidatus Binatia bacterium]|jgi:phosphotriesterase-related protein|nr:phosphotriesterase-related protein [Candidatus Binatia bacterium]